MLYPNPSEYVPSDDLAGLRRVQDQQLVIIEAALGETFETPGVDGESIDSTAMRILARRALVPLSSELAELAEGDAAHRAMKLGWQYEPSKPHIAEFREFLTAEANEAETRRDQIIGDKATRASLRMAARLIRLADASKGGPREALTRPVTRGGR